MTTHRRSFYFSEVNQDIFSFLKTKRKPNEWTMMAIRNQMMLELNRPTPYKHDLYQPYLTLTFDEYQSLIKRIEELENHPSLTQTNNAQPTPIPHQPAFNPNQLNPMPIQPNPTQPVQPNPIQPKPQPVQPDPFEWLGSL